MITIDTTNEFTWEELSEIIHVVRSERVIVLRAIQRMQEADGNLQRVEERLHDLILKHGQCS